MEKRGEGMEKLLTIEKTITEMIDLHRLVIDLKDREIQQQGIIEDLQRNVNKYRTFLENIPLRLFIKNMDLSYIYCNQSYSNDLKKQPEEVTGRTDYDLFPSDLAEKFIGDDKRVLESGELKNIEDKYLIDGQESMVHMVKAPLRDEDGNIVGLMGIFWDITQEKGREEEAMKYLAHIEGLLSNRTDELEKTSQRLQQESSERQQLEERLRQTEEIRQTIFEGTGAALAVLSEEEMIIVEANKKLEEVLGIHREEMENKKSLLEFIANGDLERIKEQSLAIRSGSDDMSGGREYRFVDQQGNKKDLFVTMALIPGTRRITASFLDVTERNRMGEALQRSEERHRWLVEKAPVAVGVIQKGVFKFTNSRIIEIFGSSQEELALRPVAEFIHTDDREMDKLLFKESNDGEFPHVFFFKIVHKDGTIRWVEDRVDLIHWEGSPATINFFTDITLRKQAEDELLSSIRTLIEKAQKVANVELRQENVERKREESDILEQRNLSNKYLQVAGVMICALNSDGEITLINRKGLDILGYKNEKDLLGKNWFDVCLPKNMVVEVKGVFNQLMSTNIEPVEYYENPVLTKNGEERIVAFHNIVLRDKDDNISGILSSGEDITERKRLEEKLRTMSIIDDLTGLYNRRGFFTLAEQQMKVTQRTMKEMLLFFADLDKMKQINDTLGHQEGDKALVEIATILKEVFRESDIIGRMGGDEFVILAIDTTNESREVLMKRLHNYLDDYNRPEGRSYTISLSIGIAPYDPKKPFSLDELMAQADTLMYEEKRNKQH